MTNHMKRLFPLIVAALVVFMAAVLTTTTDSTEAAESQQSATEVDELAQETDENAKIESALLEKAHKIEHCTVTHYAACVECCGNDLGITASGRKAAPYVSVAVDPCVIPLGSDVLVDYGDGEIKYYRADDTGSGVTGAHIDLCVENYQTAKTLGIRMATVYYIPPVEVDVN